ncbi:MAG: hypothetical protein ACETVQ_03515 [Candidatus Bathyarchaeia archaeon]
MSKQVKLDVFDKLTMRDWYRYLLYVSGILLILVMFLDAKIEQAKIIHFSIWTIGISCFIWIIDTTLRATFYYYEENGREPFSEGQKAVLLVRFSIQITAFILWAIITYQLLL